MGAAGAKSAMVSSKVGRLELTRNGAVQIITTNVIEIIQPGERAANRNPGGGGFGNAFERDIQKVVDDVRNGLVSLEGARLDYGVIITDRDTLVVDHAATTSLRTHQSVA
jgi:N-methylhydantoinase B